MPELESRAAVEPSVRQKVRVTGLYATPWHLADGTAGRELPWSLDLGRLEQYYRLSAEQLPRVLYRETLDAGAVTCRRWQPVDAVTAAWAWLFLLPSGQLVAALTVDVRSGMDDVIDLLEDFLEAASLGFWGFVAGRRAGLAGWALARTVVFGLIVGLLVLALQVFLQPGHASLVA